MANMERFVTLDLTDRPMIFEAFIDSEGKVKLWR